MWQVKCGRSHQARNTPEKKKRDTKIRSGGRSWEELIRTQIFEYNQEQSYPFQGCDRGILCAERTVCTCIHSEVKQRKEVMQEGKNAAPWRHQNGLVENCARPVKGYFGANGQSLLMVIVPVLPDSDFEYPNLKPGEGSCCRTSVVQVTLLKEAELMPTTA